MPKKRNWLTSPSGPLTPAARGRGETQLDQRRAREKLDAYNKPERKSSASAWERLTNPAPFEFDTRNGTLAAPDTPPKPKIKTRGFSAVGADLDQAPIGAGLGVGPAAGLPKSESKVRAAFGLSTRAPGEVGSAGVMTDNRRSQALAELSGIDVPDNAREVIRQQVLAGDYAAPARAASAWAALAPTAKMPGKTETAGRALAEMVVAGGQGVRDKKARDAQRYSEVAAENAAKAKLGGTWQGLSGISTGSVNGQQVAFGPGVQAMTGRQDMPLGQFQQLAGKTVGQADSKTLQGMAATGSPLAAAAVPGALGREQKAQKELYDLRYLQPAQARADGVVTVAELRQKGYDQKQTTEIMKAQLQQQTEIYKAQMCAHGIDEQKIGRAHV